MRNESWYATSREMLYHPVVGAGQPMKPADPAKGAWSRFEAMHFLIREARYKAGRVNNNGREMEIKPGQLLGAISWLATVWNWTPKAVRHFLDQLEQEGIIERTEPRSQGIEKAETRGKLEGDFGAGCDEKRGKLKGRFANILTLCNFGRYQMLPGDYGQVEGQVDDQKGASRTSFKGQHLYKEEDTKKIREGENSPSSSPKATPAPTKSSEPCQREIIFSAAEEKPSSAAEESSAHVAFEAYNELAGRIGLAKATKLTPDRAKKIKARLDSHGMDGWRKALRNIERSAFLRGQNDRGWRADLDFMLQPSSFNRLHDGGYGNGAAHTPQTFAPSGPMQTFKR